MLHNAVVNEIGCTLSSLPATLRLRVMATLLSWPFFSLCDAGRLFVNGWSPGTRIKEIIMHTVDLALFYFNLHFPCKQKLAQSLQATPWKKDKREGRRGALVSRWRGKAGWCRIRRKRLGRFHERWSHLQRQKKRGLFFIFIYSLGEPYVYLSVEAEGERRNFIKVLDEIQHDVILWKKRAPRVVCWSKSKVFFTVCCQKGSNSTKDSCTP